MAPLSNKTSLQLISQVPILHDMQADFSVALDATTRAICNANIEISDTETLSRVIMEFTGRNLSLVPRGIKERNAFLAGLVREIAKEQGWLAGWQCLAKACPDCGMHEVLMQDTATGVQVYKTLSVTNTPRPTIPDISFTVSLSHSPTSLHSIGPKSLGGHNWENNPSFKTAVKSWNAPDIPMGPCPLFAWIGVAKKIEEFENAETAERFWAAQLLGIVDYDFDRKKDDETGIKLERAVRETAKMAVEYEGRMRGAGWIGLLTMDQQMFNRHIQIDWVRSHKGPFIFGQSQVSAHDWAAAAYIDCAALAPFAYQSAEELLPSRTAMFVAVLFANMHDFLYDRGCHSRISCVPFADAEDVFQHDLPQAWVVGMIDAIATKTLSGSPDQKPLYGNNALFATCVWDIFNVRYRSWERFVKYTRLLSSSASPTSSAILKRAEAGMVLVPQNLNSDMGDAWKVSLNPANVTNLVFRTKTTVFYTLENPSAILNAHDFGVPGGLCPNCEKEFNLILHQSNDKIQAIPGLPSTVINSAPVTLSASLRRGALWAATSNACCNNCACIIGLWANNMSDKVVVSLMQTEREVCARDWLLQNYVMGCVAFCPLRLISITAGFDLNVDIKYEQGAMGERDVVDC